MNDRLLHFLSALSFYLGLAAGLPYFLGPISDILPFKVKQYVTVFLLTVAGLTKFTAFAIEYIQSQNKPK